MKNNDISSNDFSDFVVIQQILIAATYIIVFYV